MSNYNEDERQRWGSNYDQGGQSPQQPPQNAPSSLQQGQTYGPPPAQGYQQQGYQQPQSYQQQPIPNQQYQQPQGNPLQGGWNAPAPKTATLGKVSMWLAVAAVLPTVFYMIVYMVFVDTSTYTSTMETPVRLILLSVLISIISPLIGTGGVVVAIIALAKDAGKKYALIAFAIFGLGAIALLLGFVINVFLAVS